MLNLSMDIVFPIPLMFTKFVRDWEEQNKQR